jgi:hypothetical protein
MQLLLFDMLYVLLIKPDGRDMAAVTIFVVTLTVTGQSAHYFSYCVGSDVVAGDRQALIETVRDPADQP